MPLTVIAANVITQLDVAILGTHPDTTYLVVEGVTVSSTWIDETSIAFRLAEGVRHQIILNGTAIASRGIHSDCEQTTVTIGASGQVVGTIVAMTFEEAGARVLNHGMTSGLDGIRFEQAAYLFNSGTITATEIGVESTGQLTLENTGLILGGLFAVTSGVANDEIINSGTIRGQVTMGRGDDLFDGTEGRIRGVIDMGPGADTVLGGAGAETIRGGEGADEIDAGGGNDEVALDPDRDMDTLDGGLGQDTVVVLTNSAVVINLATGIARGAETGTDFLSGFERVRGGDGDDHVTGSSADNRLFGSLGNDTLLGGGGNDRVDGGLGDDRAEGGDGKDLISGGLGRDTLLGNGGNDTLLGGQEADILAGGAGADLFIWTGMADFAPSAGGAVDRITDFDTNGDLIDLSALDAPLALIQTFTFIGSAAISGPGQVAVRQSGGNTFVDIASDIGATGTIRLDGLITLEAADFVL